MLFWVYMRGFFGLCVLLENMNCSYFLHIGTSRCPLANPHPKRPSEPTCYLIRNRGHLNGHPIVRVCIMFRAFKRARASRLPILPVPPFRPRASPVPGGDVGHRASRSAGLRVRSRIRPPRGDTEPGAGGCLAGSGSPTQSHQNDAGRPLLGGIWDRASDEGAVLTKYTLVVQLRLGREPASMGRRSMTSTPATRTIPRIPTPPFAAGLSCCASPTITARKSLVQCIM